MKLGLPLSGVVTALVVGGVVLGCQTYDFEPVEPLAIAQTTKIIPVASRKPKPNIMLLVDKSGSMLQPAGSGTRLSEMKNAMATFLTQFGATARLGLAMFPDTRDANTCATACISGKVFQPIVQSADVEAQLQAAAAQINDTIQSITDPAVNPNAEHLARGGTPTAGSLTALANIPELQEATRDNFVLLLTDGLPNCNTALDGNTCVCTAATCGAVNCNCLDQAQVVQVINALAAKQIKTIVVGFGAETGASVALPVLNAMAEAGGFARKCETAADCGGSDTCDQVGTEKLCSTRFYQAADAQQLAGALARIGSLIGNSDPCVFKLDATPSDPAFLTVYVNSEKIGSGDQTWRYEVVETQPTVTFQGDLCTRVLNATVTDPLNVEIRVVEGL